MNHEDDTLRALWEASQQAQPPRSEGNVDEGELAAWLEHGCPEDELIEAALADQPTLREAVSLIQLEGVPAAESAPHGLEQRLLPAVLDQFETRRDRGRRPAVIGSIRVQVSAAAAAIAVAALGFIFGRVAAPATSEATTDFVTIVTFEMLSDDDSLESILMSTGLAVDATNQGDAP